MTEPFAIQNKFPHAMVQVHYARGCTLAEAFYQAVYAPYQLIVVGDPLCRPWANIPQIAVDGVKAGGTLKDKVSLHATATLPRGGSVDRFELFVDGERVASKAPASPWSWIRACIPTAIMSCAWWASRTAPSNRKAGRSFRCGSTTSGRRFASKFRRIRIDRCDWGKKSRSRRSAGGTRRGGLSQ